MIIIIDIAILLTPIKLTSLVGLSAKLEPKTLHFWGVSLKPKQKPKNKPSTSLFPKTPQPQPHHQRIFYPFQTREPKNTQDSSIPKDWKFWISTPTNFDNNQIKRPVWEWPKQYLTFEGNTTTSKPLAMKNKKARVTSSSYKKRTKNGTKSPPFQHIKNLNFHRDLGFTDVLRGIN